MSALPTLMRKGNLVAPNQLAPNSAEVQKELDSWIPYVYVCNWIRDRIVGKTVGVNNRALPIKSETASGKSTLLPPELYRMMNSLQKSGALGIMDMSASIICTQPRVLTAIENVNEMMKHYSSLMTRGETIGWSTKNNKFRNKKYGLLSATIGTLVQQLLSSTDDEIASMYSIIIIDEAHERDMMADLCFSLLKGLLFRLRDQKKCPFVLIMSATFDPEDFLDYFAIPIDTNFIYCRGQTAGFEEKWDWNDGRVVNNYPQAAADLVSAIVNMKGKNGVADESAKADILIFLPGKAEFLLVIQWLDKINRGIIDGDHPERAFSVIQMDSEEVAKQEREYKYLMVIPVQNHTIIVSGKPQPDVVAHRRVILTTNVAETGLTLPNLKYVIDSGFNRERFYDPIHNISGIITVPAPKSRQKQRKGRAGRLFPGVFYPLYPEYIYDALPDNQLPQILTDDVSKILMSIITQQIRAKNIDPNTGRIYTAKDHEYDDAFDPFAIDMLDPPTPDALRGAISRLSYLGFISARKSDDAIADSNVIMKSVAIRPTKLGLLAMSTGLQPEHAKMILMSYIRDVPQLDIATIVAWLSYDLNTYTKIGGSGAKTEKVTGGSGSSDADDTTAHAKKSSGHEILWDIVYNFVFGEKKGSGALLRDRFCSDAIDGLVLYFGLEKVSREAGFLGANVAIYDWCLKIGVSYTAAIRLIKARDDVIAQCLDSGLKMFGKKSASIINNAVGGTTPHQCETIERLIDCVRDAYGNQVLTYNKKKSIHHTRDGTKVTVAERFATRDNLVYIDLGMKMDKTNLVYNVVANRIT